MRVDNGMLARIVSIDHARGDVEIDVRGSGRRIVLSAAYLAAGWVDHGYAMTIHKAQGSQFEHVLFLLPDRDSPLLTRELVYTGVTRASKGVDVWYRDDVFRRSVNRNAVRNSGLRDALAVPSSGPRPD